MKIENIELNFDKYIKLLNTDTPSITQLSDIYNSFLAFLNTNSDVQTIDEEYNLFRFLLQELIPTKLYKYMSFDNCANKKYSTLLNKKIYMASSDELNDPFDNRAYFCKNEYISDSFDPSTLLLSSSFSYAGYDSLPMWANYAGNHTGACISYNLNNNCNTELKGCIFPVNYIEERIDISSFMSIVFQKLTESKLSKESYFQKYPALPYLICILSNYKHSSWSYEKEFRCTIAANNPLGKLFPAVPEAIYVGMKCKDETQTQLKLIAERIDIPIYKMDFDAFDENYHIHPYEI